MVERIGAISESRREEIPTFSSFLSLHTSKPKKKEEGIKEKSQFDLDFILEEVSRSKSRGKVPDDGENPRGQKQEIFYESRRKGASFLNVWRTKNPEVKDYATWPSQLTWHLCLPFTVNWAIGRRKDGWYSYTSYSEAKPKKNLERKGTW